MSLTVWLRWSFDCQCPWCRCDAAFVYIMTFVLLLLDYMTCRVRTVLSRDGSGRFHACAFLSYTLKTHYSDRQTWQLFITPSKTVDCQNRLRRDRINPLCLRHLRQVHCVFDHVINICHDCRCCMSVWCSLRSCHLVHLCIVCMIKGHNFRQWGDKIARFFRAHTLSAFPSVIFMVSRFTE